MTTVSAAVVAHTARQEMAEALASSLNCPISWDDGTIGSVANHDVALELAAQAPADWFIAMEDDAEPVNDFLDQAAAALSTSPVPYACLYFGWVEEPDPKIAFNLQENDPHWYMLQGWANTVCVAVRHDHLEPLMRTSFQVSSELPHLPADHRWGEAARRLGHAWIPHSNPSLVQHSDVPSLIAGPAPPRRAYRVGTRDRWEQKCL